MSNVVQSVAYRLRSVAPTKEFKFQARIGDNGSHGTATLTVDAKNPADAWAKVIRNNRGILPHLQSLTLLEST